MTNELTFRLSFIAIFILMTIIRLYYHYKAGTFRERVYTQTEGKLVAALRGLLAVPWFIATLIYMIYPQGMIWAGLSLPTWLRWSGVVLAGLSVLLLFWVNYALGKNFSTTLVVREDHTLVTHGPYRWVRHPMYTVIVLLIIAFFFLSANWFIGLIGLLIITLVMTVRTPKEEAMMIDKFGNEYRTYMERTGRFLPRFI
jgi:protein-S-isoprenylcysteine O-methyltransferase Ste14